MGMRLWAAALPLALIAGCGDRGQDARIKGIESQFADFEKSVKELREGQESLRNDVSKIQFERFLEKSDSATFDIASRGYGKVEHNNGFFLIALVDVKPKADGQVLTFNFGNPLASEYSGVKFKVKWGPRPPRNLKGAEFWKARAEAQQQMQEMDVALPDRLGPGSWNPVSFTIAPAPSDKVGLIELSEMRTDTVRLRQ